MRRYLVIAYDGSIYTKYIQIQMLQREFTALSAAEEYVQELENNYGNNYKYAIIIHWG